MPIKPKDPRPCRGQNVNICVAEGCFISEYMGTASCLLVANGHIRCRCGCRQFDLHQCDHPIKIPRLCRWGMHKWSIVTVPANVKWCYRCGQKADGFGTFLIDKNRNEVVR